MRIRASKKNKFWSIFKTSISSDNHTFTENIFCLYILEVNYLQEYVHKMAQFIQKYIKNVHIHLNDEKI